MSDVVITIFWGLVLLTIIVFIHEGGHFLAARAFGVRVKEFVIGLPGPKLAFKRKDTLYGVTAIPLGGYCMIAGMEKGKEDMDLLEKTYAFITYFGDVCEDEASFAAEQRNLGVDLVCGLDTLADWGTVRRYRKNGLTRYAIAEATAEGRHYGEGEYRELLNPRAYLESERKRTYIALPWWKRVVVLCAGSFFNLLAAMAILIVLLMVNGVQLATTTIDTVEDGSPAAEAGLLPGDKLVFVDDTSVDSWKDFRVELQAHEVGSEIELGYVRDGSERSVTLTLAERDGSPMIGVSSLVERQPIDFFEAAQASFSLIGSVLEVIFQLFNPATFADTIGQTSSVVGISMEARTAAEAGPANFIILVAGLSLSIGIMNLLPVPPLDGGKIIIETIERVSRRRIPVSVINGVSLAGIAALVFLFFMATNADIHRYFLGW
jgi:regulator of sigma E protease